MTVKTMEPVGVDVSTLAPEVEHAQRGTLSLEIVGEGEHVDRRASEAVEGRDDEGAPAWSTLRARSNSGRRARVPLMPWS